MGDREQKQSYIRECALK